MITYKNGNLLESNCDIICHQVNCQGVMGSGVAKAVKDKFPQVFNAYVQFVNSYPTVLGQTQVVKVSDNQHIANLFGQYNYGTSGERFTSYDAIDTALSRLKYFMMENNLNSISFPYKMSSDRGGADWDVILALINSSFKDTEITIEIWSLNGYPA